MTILRYYLAVIALTIFLIPGSAWANQLARYSFTMEVTSVTDPGGYLDGLITVGDQMQGEYQNFTTPSHRSAPWTFKNGWKIANLSLSKGDYTFEREPEFYENYVVSYWPDEIERADGKCRTRVAFQMNTSYFPVPADITRFAKFRVEWENEICYGDDKFEEPDPLPLDDFELTKIVIINMVAPLGEDRHFEIELRPLNIELVELRGGIVEVMGFNDLNRNCLLDPGEPSLGGFGFREENEGISNSRWVDGLSDIYVTQNNGSIDVQYGDDWQSSCGKTRFDYAFEAGSSVVRINVPLTEATAGGGALKIGADAARVGKSMQYRIFVSNPNDVPFSGQLQVEYDNVISPTAQRPAVSTNSNGVLSWDIAELPPGERRLYFVDAALPNDPLLQGQDLCVTASLTEQNGSLVGEESYCQKIVGKLDQLRLSKLKRERAEQEKTIEAGDDIDFVLHINNTDERTVTSMRVLIPAHPDIVNQELAAGVASHPYTSRVTDDGGLELNFTDVNLAALDGSAFVHFTARLREELNTATLIENYVQVQLEYAAEDEKPGPVVELLTSNVVTSQIGDVVSSVESQEVDHLELRVYPNPSTDHITIQHPHLAGARIQVLDQLGRDVGSFVADAEMLQLNTDSMPVGLYVLRIEFKSGGLETVRFGLVR